VTGLGWWREKIKEFDGVGSPIVAMKNRPQPWVEEESEKRRG
jgi:hypothetical protein